MSRIATRGIQCLVAAVAFNVAANAQQVGSAERAPIPRQVLTAKTVFVGNGGSESYGADSYYRLTKYDGGPNRAYSSFYTAVQQWGHYELVGSTNDADLMLVIRFANPVVDRENPGTRTELPHEWVYDPQLNLSINDPKTGLPLWAITEHIEPGKDRAADNQHFDEAVTRLVDDLEGLILNPEVSLAPENNALPPGAIAAAERSRRLQHAGIGMLLGASAGLAIFSREAACHHPEEFNGDCYSHPGAKAMNGFLLTFGGMLVGSLLGWAVP